MRTIRRLLLLTILGAAAYNYWPDIGWPQVSRAAALEAEHAKQHAATLAVRAAEKASAAAGQVGESALTAKINSKMALDDQVNARAINVDTSGSVVTLTGVVSSPSQRDRAVRLARETDGITRVIDRLRVVTN
jgi:hyperosmotically inducible protein